MREIRNMRQLRPFLALLVLVGCLAIAGIGPSVWWPSVWRVGASDPLPGGASGEAKAGGDWPMWGGSGDRNMVSSHKGLPTSWDIEKKVNVKWVSTLGSQSYGNPSVSAGMVFVGTNNEALFSGVSSIDVPLDETPPPPDCPEGSTDPKCPPKQETQP